MKDLLEYIVMNLVSKPENIKIDEQRDNGNVNLTLTVDPADMGLIIGKGGQTIHSIRRLLTIRAMAENIRVNLQLSEPQGESRVEHQESGEDNSNTTAEASSESETPEEPPESTEEDSKEKS